jgi:hypothetical protein
MIIFQGPQRALRQGLLPLEHLAQALLDALVNRAWGILVLRSPAARPVSKPMAWSTVSME